ncbi:MAG: elongation factor P, partial [Pirellulaceae bacterium]|nr:elongation factor P [Pirellulaceae bacterium]
PCRIERMLAKDIKNGSVVNYEGSPVIIESMSVQTPSARGAATLYKFRGRQLLSGQKTDITLKGTESLEEADFQRQAVSIMYSDTTHLHLMDQQTYNQYSLDRELVAEQMNYVTESLEGILGLIYNDECVGIQLPSTVELAISECDPGVKGNSATGRTKPATLETGLVVQVPEYLRQGERIKVDTRSGDFLSRAT